MIHKIRYSGKCKIFSNMLDNNLYDAVSNRCKIKTMNKVFDKYMNWYEYKNDVISDLYMRINK